MALTAYLVDLGAENLLLLLIICAITNIVLGLGLPTLAVYVMLAILVAPALVKVGVPAMAAHLFILYFGIMSLITPPIATAAFVAATIAKTDPMAAGWTAMRFGWASYIVPFLFVYSPALSCAELRTSRRDGSLDRRHLVRLRRHHRLRVAGHAAGACARS